MRWQLDKVCSNQKDILTYGLKTKMSRANASLSTLRYKSSLQPILLIDIYSNLHNCL